MALPPSQWQVQIMVGAGSRGVAAAASRSRGRRGAECGGGGRVRCGGAIKAFRCILSLSRQPRAGLRMSKKRSGTCSHDSASEGVHDAIVVCYHLFLEDCLLEEILEGFPEPEDGIPCVLDLFAGEVAAPAPCFIRPFKQNSNHSE
jgi:hypothetical protein